ncbi:MAG: tetratricopeptide repeat protein [candidate division Zixibacteria bacterium]|nr:tetratricopeptide repeat protein [candidate division Zixibacteria bacterium]
MTENEERHEKAVELFRDDKFGEALDIFLKLNELLPKELDKKILFENISHCYANMGEFEKADEFYEKAIGTVEDSIWSKYLNAILLFKRAKFIDSINELEAIPSSYMDKYNNAEKNYWLGKNYYYLDDYEKSNIYFEKSYLIYDKDEDPEGYAQLIYEYGSVLDELGEEDTAFKFYCELDDYIRFLNQTNRLSLYYCRSLKRKEKGEIRKALSDVLKSHDIGRDLYHCDQEDINMRLILMARLYREVFEYENALNSLNKIEFPLSDDYDYWHYYRNYSIAHYELGNYEDAIKHMEKFIEAHKIKQLFPIEEFHQFKLKMADAYFKTSDFEKAMNLYKELLDSNLASADDYILIKDRLNVIESS